MAGLAAADIGITDPQINGTEAMANATTCLTLIGLTFVTSLLHRQALLHRPSAHRMITRSRIPRFGADGS